MTAQKDGCRPWNGSRMLLIMENGRCGQAKGEKETCAGWENREACAASAFALRLTSARPRSNIHLPFVHLESSPISYMFSTSVRMLCCRQHDGLFNRCT